MAVYQSSFVFGDFYFPQWGGKKERAAATMPESQEASNYDEVSMKQSMLFSDGLKVVSEICNLFDN